MLTAPLFPERDSPVTKEISPVDGLVGVLKIANPLTDDPVPDKIEISPPRFVAVPALKYRLPPAPSPLSPT
jgi:hypothetical protein